MASDTNYNEKQIPEMIFELSDISIKERLIKNTKRGNPALLFTPFAGFDSFFSNQKTFFGNIEKNTFKLTLNRSFFPLPYFIEGSLSKVNDFETEIIYELKPMRLVIWLTSIARFISIIVFLIIISLLPDLKSQLVVSVLYISYFIALPAYMFNFNKKNLKKEFLKILN